MSTLSGEEGKGKEEGGGKEHIREWSFGGVISVWLRWVIVSVAIWEWFLHLATLRDSERSYLAMASPFVYAGGFSV